MTESLIPALSSSKIPSMIITPYSVESVGPGLAVACGYFGTGQSTTWTTNNTAMFFPFTISEPFVVDKVFIANGSAVAGTWDVGVFDNASTPNRLLSAAANNGNVAITQTGTSVIHAFDVTNYTLAPGNYYLALGMSNNSGTVITKRLLGTVYCQAMGCAQMATDVPLGTTATFAAYSGSVVPVFGISSRSLIS